MKITRAILVGIGFWLFGVTLFNLSYEFPILNNPDQQANMVLFIVVIPLVWLGCRIYYRENATTHGYKLGTVLLLTATFLDAVITVPLFIIPQGGNHFTFFVNLGFWIIAFEIITITILYYYSMVYPRKKKNQKASSI